MATNSTSPNDASSNDAQDELSESPRRSGGLLIRLGGGSLNLSVTDNPHDSSIRYSSQCFF